MSHHKLIAHLIKKFTTIITTIPQTPRGKGVIDDGFCLIGNPYKQCRNVYIALFQRFSWMAAVGYLGNRRLGPLICQKLDFNVPTDKKCITTSKIRAVFHIGYSFQTWLDQFYLWSVYNRQKAYKS